jgi:hypothetical protein
MPAGTLEGWAVARLPNNRPEMAALLASAFEAHAPPDDPEINDEHLQMLIEGRLDELDDRERNLLFSQLAAAPWAAALLAQIKPVAPDLPVTDRFAPIPWLTARRLFAMAACLTLALLVWRFADPPPGSDSLVPHLSRFGSSSNSYWDGFTQQNLRERQTRDRIRDIATVVMCIIAVCLGIMSLWRESTKSRRK